MWRDCDDFPFPIIHMSCDVEKGYSSAEALMLCRAAEGGYLGREVIQPVVSGWFFEGGLR